LHATYTFDFLTTVSKQLVEKLDSLPVTPLAANLDAVAEFQRTSGFVQGVYLLHEGALPVYLGKADDVHDRLKQHLRKLSGRRNIVVADIGYKALLLDQSMSTAANEDVLIRLFEAQHEAMWNRRGFGPKDPGKERDTTAPSVFDRDHPIIENFPMENVQDQETVGTLLRKMKDGLPYVFRFSIGTARTTPIDLTGVPRNAEALLRAAVHVLPQGWHGAILSYGMVVYNVPPKQYPAGVVVIESGI
jgi:Eco29kI restriction endonuclease